MTDFGKVVVSLWGERWMVRSVVELEADERTVRRWYHGQREVPHGVWIDLAAKCTSRSLELREAFETALDNMPMCGRRNGHSEGREGLSDLTRED